jgi:hypothetical protein
MCQHTGDLVSTLMCSLPVAAAPRLREAGVPAACVEAVQSTVARGGGEEEAVDALLRALEALCDDPEATLVLAEHASLVATLSGMLPTAGVRALPLPCQEPRHLPSPSRGGKSRA